KELPACFAANTHPAGYAPLRQSIANYVSLVRGVRCTWQQVIVTAGIQQGLDFAARILLDNDDRVLVEDPGFLGSYGALMAAGARLVPAGVDSEGMRVDATCSARMAVVTPSSHFPLGVTMSLRRRLELLAWSQARSVWVLEDDYDGEFRRMGVP